ncbi:family 1 carbohydrate esterase [Piromyces sp. E2]|nr:family 1 carbohydrate esterase [Piromyces sp. E2]|eukprot:OUM58976.1 family 1 carbohydrate esterase [Piromyces sp. E2]
MKLSVALCALAALVAGTSAASLERRQWPNWGGNGQNWGGNGGQNWGGNGGQNWGGNGGGFNGGGQKTINDFKKVSVSGRDIHVYAPSNLAPNSPLLLSLHGMDQDPNYQQSNTHWETLADSEGFVVVYPRGGTGMSTWDIQGDKDTKWVLQIIDQMVKDYNIDKDRVYLSGFSMGGMFTYHAMSKIGDKIAAFAPCSGPNVFGASKAMRPVPIFHVHGTNDDVLNYNQVEGFLKNYRDQFHCPSQADVKTNYPNSENPNATLYTWGPCDKDVYIKHLKLQGRGHSPSKADIKDIWDFVKEWSVNGKISASGNTNPGNSNPGNTNPGNTNPGNSNPGNSNPGNNGSCWSKALGFPCCVNKSIVAFTDENGQWGVENNNWCGKPNTNNKNCWATALGYKCCSTSTCRNAQYSDQDGQWDVENGQWCGISTANTLFLMNVFDNF